MEFVDIVAKYFTSNTCLFLIIVNHEFTCTHTFPVSLQQAFQVMCAIDLKNTLRYLIFWNTSKNTKEHLLLQCLPNKEFVRVGYYPRDFRLDPAIEMIHNESVHLPDLGLPFQRITFQTLMSVGLERAKTRFLIFKCIGLQTSWIIIKHGGKSKLTLSSKELIYVSSHWAKRLENLLKAEIAIYTIPTLKDIPQIWPASAETLLTIEKIEHPMTFKTHMKRRFMPN